MEVGPLPAQRCLERTGRLIFSLQVGTSVCFESARLFCAVRLVQEVRWRDSHRDGISGEVALSVLHTWTYSVSFTGEKKKFFFNIFTCKIFYMKNNFGACSTFLYENKITEHN